MSNWVKFSDRLPTEADADIDGNVMVLRPDNSWCIKKCYGTAGSIMSNLWVIECGDLHLLWLESVPKRPKPRTLEDVVREYVDTGKPQRVLDLLKEMKEFIGVE